MKPLSTFILAAVLFSTGSLSAPQSTHNDVATTHDMHSPMQTQEMPHTTAAATATHHTGQHHMFITQVTMHIQVTQPDNKAPMVFMPDGEDSFGEVASSLEQAKETQAFDGNGMPPIYAHSTQASPQTTAVEGTTAAMVFFPHGEGDSGKGGVSVEQSKETQAFVGSDMPPKYPHMTEASPQTTAVEGTTAAMVLFPQGGGGSGEGGVSVEQAKETPAFEDSGMPPKYPHVTQPSPTPSVSEKAPPSEMVDTPTAMKSVTPTVIPTEPPSFSTPTSSPPHVVTPTPSASPTTTQDVKALETGSNQQDDGGLSTWQYALVAALCVSVGGAVLVVLSRVVKRHRNDRRRFARLRDNEDNVSYSGDSGAPMQGRF
eukprot:comp17179_c0_seq1/m.16045 comp17179_c0_seq1/g.16045  ORF comp17179_c0_seq1/g.16045 comp17179_c0_seq1/m.16045 type:complete len:372 (-) comp17179_c0_seq1:129-1244(-)